MYKDYETLDTQKVSKERADTSKYLLTKQVNKMYKMTNQKSYGTRARYKQSTKDFINFLSNKFGLQNIQNITEKHVFAYVDYLIDEDYKPATIKTNLSGIRFTHYLIENPKMEEFPINNAFDLDRRVAELKEFESVCKSLNREDVLAASQLSRTLGLRINEVIVLKKNKLESALRTNVLELKKGDGTKGGRPRNIPLTKESRLVIERLNSQVGRGEYVIRGEQTTQRHLVKKSIMNFFSSNRDKFQNEKLSTAEVKVKGEVIEVQRDLRFHSFRYTYAQDRYYNFIKEGKTKEEAEYLVSSLLGHNRPEITRRYL